MALTGSRQSMGTRCVGEGEGRGLRRRDLGQRKRKVTEMSYARGIDEWRLDAMTYLGWLEK
jgi:hypothetical protein